MHTLFRKRLPARLLLLILGSALAACSSEISQDGPILSNGSVAVAPSTAALGQTGTTGCLGLNGFPTSVAATRLDTVTYTITTFNARGEPIGNADIGISLSFTESTVFGGIALTALVDDGTYVSFPGASPIYETTTDENGTKQVTVFFETTDGCSYDGTMFLTSGSVSADSTFTVTGTASTP